MAGIAGVLLGLICVESLAQNEVPPAGRGISSRGFHWPLGRKITDSGNWLHGPAQGYGYQFSRKADGAILPMFHLGIDLESDPTVNREEPVRALTSGRIVAYRNGGNVERNMYVWVEHLLRDGNRFYAIYGHVIPLDEDGRPFPEQDANTATDVAVNIPVKAGQVIARVKEWKTAQGDNTHLHLGIREDGPFFGKPEIGLGWARMIRPEGEAGEKEPYRDWNRYHSPFEFLERHRAAGE